LVWYTEVVQNTHAVQHVLFSVVTDA